MLTHFAGPFVISGTDGSGTESNPTPGPSLFRHGVGLFDPRFNPNYGGDISAKNYGWFGNTRIPVLNAVPSAITTANYAALQVPVAGTPLTLVSVTGAGITAGVSIANALTGNLVTGLLAVDGAMGTLNLGDYPAISMYDPAKALARNVRITSAADDTLATFLVSGYDIYGFPMSELITGVNNAAASGKKAFKYVASVTPAGTLSGSNVSVGTGDVYGFPLRVDFWGNVEIFWNSALITATTGFVAAVTTDPATTTTGDTRGTYAVQSASDATKRLQVFVTPMPATLSNTGLFGIQQV